MLVLDSGGLSRLARRDVQAGVAIAILRRQGLWPPRVPTVVIVESLTGRQRIDANVNRFLKSCDVEEQLSEGLARRASELRSAARQGSAVDAVVVATAEPHGTVITDDLADLRALASHADDVTVRRL